MTGLFQNPTADLFPVPTGSESEHLNELRLGYEDLSNGEASCLLQTLPNDVVAAIYKFTFDGPINVIGLVSHVSGLLEGLDAADPERKSRVALETAQIEIERSIALTQAFRDNPRLPFVGKLHSPDDLSPDMARMGWGVIDTSEEAQDANIYLPTLTIMERYLANPTDNASAYEKAMLVFMNDAIFRPGVSFSR